MFKTNVEEPAHAERLLHHIHQKLMGYTANFDLQDHDHILRVECCGGLVESILVIDLIKNSGFTAEILPDEI